MKTQNQMKLFKYYAILNLALSPIVTSAYAQADRGGNGGDPNELAEFTGRNGEHLSSWYQVKQDLIKGLEANQHLGLDLGTQNQDSFKSQALSALKTVKVEFTEREIKVNGVARVCKNFEVASEKHIECNTKTYVAAMQNYTSDEQYKLIAHEYFGAAGIEPNTYGTSDYQFSSQISSSLKEVVVKRWSVTIQDDCPEVTGKFMCTGSGEMTISKNSDGYLLTEDGFLMGESQSSFPLNRWNPETNNKASCQFGNLYLSNREHIRGENSGYYENIFEIHQELGGITIIFDSGAMVGTLAAFSCVRK